MASAQCQHLLPRVAPRRVYATAITTPCRQSRQLHSDPTYFLRPTARSPFAAMHGAQTWALQPAPPQAAPTRRRTRSSKQVSSGGVVRAESGNASQSSRLRRQHLAPVHFAFQAQHSFSRREPQPSRITLMASTSALLPTLFASSQSSALRISGRQDALSCSHSSRQHGQPCPDAQPQLVHHPRLVHVHVHLLCQQSPAGFSTTRVHTGVPRANSTAALPTRLAATTPILPPPTVPPSPQSAAANCHSATPVPAFIATKPVRHHHFDHPNTARTTGSRSLIDSLRSHFRNHAAGKRYGKGYGNGQAKGEQSGRSIACSLAAQR
jgi:hypothetical protein